LLKNMQAGEVMSEIASDDANQPEARFLGGTLVLEGVERTATPPEPFRWVNAKWRCPAVHYRAVRPWLKEQNIRNRIPRWQDLSLEMRDDREPHPYQAEALDAWLEAGSFGSVVLPTGAGKTFLALQAIARCAVSTLVVVPTLDLLHQWYARLENAFGPPIGGIFSKFRGNLSANAQISRFVNPI
jgi:primosomal protein N'